jgi:hypothetical protein
MKIVHGAEELYVIVVYDGSRLDSSSFHLYESALYDENEAVRVATELRESKKYNKVEYAPVWDFAWEFAKKAQDEAVKEGRVTMC